MRAVGRGAVLAELRSLGWRTRVVQGRDGVVRRGASRIDPSGRRTYVALDVLARGRHVVVRTGAGEPRVVALRASTDEVLDRARMASAWWE